VAAPLAAGTAGSRPWIGPGAAEALAVLGVLVALEVGVAAALPRLSGAAALWTTGAVRGGEIALCLAYWVGRGWELGDLGVIGVRARRGFWVGIQFSAAVAAVVVLGEAAGRLALGRSFLASLAGSGPGPGEWAALLAVGAGVAPLFEELAFRRILYGGLRQRLGPLAAGLAATAVFAAAHLLTARVPWVQAVGGLLFFAAYEVSRSLWAPILVHGAGNLALFLLPLWVR